MEINVANDRKMVEIWLTKGERDDAALREKLRGVYAECHRREYDVAVYLSGEESLEDNIRALLLHNKRRGAEREVQREKERAVSRLRS